MGPTDLSRRMLLKEAGLAGLAFSLGSAGALAAPLSWFEPADTVIPFVDIPSDFSTTRDGVVVRLDLRELTSWTTPVEQFFGVQHYNVPALDAAAWKLDVSGLIGQKKTITFDELKKRPRADRTLFFECSGNQARAVHGLMGNATWTGASLRDLLDEVRPAGDAREAVFWAADTGEETIRGNKYTMHFARSMSVEDALAADAILAYEMNGQPLTPGHGSPVRLIVPGWYGVANVKWITGIELIDHRFMNRFMGRDYVTVMGRQVGDHVEYTETSVTRMRVKSVIARVTRAADKRVKVFGAAWSEGTPLKSVDVKIDDGPWQAATFSPSPAGSRAGVYAWRFFTLDAPPLAPGRHTLVSRATDQKGREQPASLEMKKTYWEDNAQFVRTVDVGS